MKRLLDKLPLSASPVDRWCGVDLPPKYEILTAQAGPAWFVDGGNAQIIGAPHFSLQKLRVVALREPGKKIEQKETFCLITKVKEGWRLEYEGGETLSIEGEIGDAVSYARMRLEEMMALQVSTDGELVVLDGDTAPENCIALQKSITVLTDNGYPLASVLTRDGAWCAQLGTFYAVKLHERARHILLVHGANKEQLKTLCHYSSDSVFPGYPAPLVLADRLARVSNEEAAALRVRAKAMIKDTNLLKAAEAANDSHSILDSMG